MNTVTELESQPRVARGNEVDDDPSTDPRPIGEIANDIWLKAETLIRQEMKLGITDAQERLEVLRDDLESRAAQLQAVVTAKAAGGALMFIGAQAVAAALILLLSQVIPAWSSALIFGVVTAGGGIVLVNQRLKALRPLNTRELLPKRALESTKRDIQAIEEAMK